MYKKILLPTDGSTYADQEVERVVNLIADDGEIIVLSVAGRLTSSAFQSRKKVRKVNEKLKKEAQGYVDNMAAYVSMSRSYFQHLYRETFGVSCIADVIS